MILEIRMIITSIQSAVTPVYLPVGIVGLGL